MTQYHALKSFARNALLVCTGNELVHSITFNFPLSTKLSTDVTVGSALTFFFFSFTIH